MQYMPPENKRDNNALVVQYAQKRNKSIYRLIDISFPIKQFCRIVFILQEPRFAIIIHIRLITRQIRLVIDPF
jgi:hypothetical protein